MKKLFYLSIPFMIFLFSACGSKDFKQTDSGLTYKIHQSNRGDKALIDNIVKMEVAYRYPEDSVFFHTKDIGELMYIPVIPSEYAGDIYEGLRMLAKGDSATFKFDAMSFFITTAKTPILDFIGQEDSIYVDIKVLDIFTQEQYNEYVNKQREERIKEQEIAKHLEEDLLQDYLSDNNITVESEESGLIIVIEEEGTGPKPQSGQNVTVHYTGKILDGTVFDSSVERGQPFTFRLGRGQVIRGWDEGVSKLNVGSRATLIIPSYLAYADQQRGPVITPFSTLIFEIEVLGVE
ncbi:MAG: FKBP-type peptidyl-prolyl cis-trans isomerase [Bacteroidetes bacterium]|nr:MAG: FKBP-type peptidyl-prolyl cis-trans isomerase [Bacteroidota bacterium]